MRVLYLTNIPSPYRVDFFNELGKFCELTVLFETRYSKERDERWVSETEVHYKSVFMNGIRHGVAEAICPEVIKYLSPKKFDIIVVGMYSSPTGMLAIEYMRLKKIKFILNTDGGLIKEESGIQRRLKAHFIGAASAWLSTGDMATEYLCYYGAKREKIYKYPFTSVKQDEIISANLMSGDMKEYMKKKLGIKEKTIILAVGRFTYEGVYGKEFDTVLKAAERIDPSIGIYIVGDEPTEEFIKWKEEKKLTHVHYIGFQKKNELAKYYAAADLLVLMTKMDVWGLVINEAMMYALPIITTNQCGAGVELVRNGENGYVIPVSDYNSLAEKVAYILSDSSVTYEFGKRSYEIIFYYTLEHMAERHYETFKKLYVGEDELIKQYSKEKIGIHEKKMILSVGQFVYRKGFDILIRACKSLSPDVGVYIVGGKAILEYTELLNKLGIDNIHFIEFKTKIELIEYYRAADVFVLPTREDIWGLVINEAMAFGLPIVTTDKCGAGIEMVKNNRNGYIIHSDAVEELAAAICQALDYSEQMVADSLNTAKAYTIENMASEHIKIFKKTLNG